MLQSMQPSQCTSIVVSVVAHLCSQTTHAYDYVQRLHNQERRKTQKQNKSLPQNGKNITYAYGTACMRKGAPTKSGWTVQVLEGYNHSDSKYFTRGCIFSVVAKSKKEECTQQGQQRPAHPPPQPRPPPFPACKHADL